jgi:type IV secretion system protein VirB9
MTWRCALLLLAILAGEASAEIRPQPGLGDPRIQTVSYQADQVVLIEGATG